MVGPCPSCRQNNASALVEHRFFGKAAMQVCKFNANLVYTRILTCWLAIAFLQPTATLSPSLRVTRGYRGLGGLPCTGILWHAPIESATTHPSR